MAMLNNQMVNPPLFQTPAFQGPRQLAHRCQDQAPWRKIPRYALSARMRLYGCCIVRKCPQHNKRYLYP